MGNADSTTPVRVSRNNPMPAYAQLADGLRGHIVAGSLRPGDAVPSVSALAEQSNLSTNTVMRALAQLAHEGLITTRRGARTVVAPSRGRSTEMLLCYDDRPQMQYRVEFFDKLVAGVSSARAGLDHRIMITYVARGLPTADELLQTCRLRRADGLLAYRPRKEVAQALRTAANDMAVAAIFGLIPDAPADSILPTMDPLRDLLLQRIAEGKRAFGFVAEDFILKEDASVEPYAMLYRTFQETLSAAGIKPVNQVYPFTMWTAELSRQVSERAGNAEVVVTTCPDLLRVRDERGPAEWISYTESPRTLEELRGKATLLYLGIESVGRVAADALASRAASGGTLPARRIELVPEVIAQPKKPA